MGIIGACLPVMRQPLKQFLPRLFGSSKSAGRYYDDRFTDEYVLQNVSNPQKDGSNTTWHNVSVSGPEYFRPSQQRKSDELRIIGDTLENADRDSGAEVDGTSSMSQNVIPKNVVVHVDRK